LSDFGGILVEKVAGTDLQTQAKALYEVYLACATQWVNPETYDEHRLILDVGG
jgi:hypothetical protein